MAVCGLDDNGATQLVDYLVAGIGALGVLPTQVDVVFERFFDEAAACNSSCMRHSGAGSTSARPRTPEGFCATFDFELQAAANDDAFVLSLGPQHSFPDTAPGCSLQRPRRRHSHRPSWRSPMFTSRWRWNLNRSFGSSALQRWSEESTAHPAYGSRRSYGRGISFPAACQENAPAGPIVIPDHVLVRQTLYDCLHEAMDVDGLVRVIQGFESGSVRTHFVDSPEPSVLSHEILNGKPYTFLDDAPLEERRTRAVQLRRGLPVQAGDLGKLDELAIARVRDEAAPVVRDAEELHDLLVSLVVCRAKPEWVDWFTKLRGEGRVMTAHVTASETAPELWCALERKRWVEAMHKDVVFEPALPTPSFSRDEEVDEETCATESLRGYLDVLGPVTVSHLADQASMTRGMADIALARLEAEGFVMRGWFDPALQTDPGSTPETQWCSRRLLARIHSYTQNKLRSEIEPVTAQDYMRFLVRWQHVLPGTLRQGRAGVLAVVDQLQGFEVPAGSWEESVLTSRVEHYRSRWLEDLCMSGELAWGRLEPPRT